MNFLTNRRIFQDLILMNQRIKKISIFTINAVFQMLNYFFVLFLTFHLLSIYIIRTYLSLNKGSFNIIFIYYILIVPFFNFYGLIFWTNQISIFFR